MQAAAHGTERAGRQLPTGEVDAVHADVYLELELELELSLTPRHGHLI